MASLVAQGGCLEGWTVKHVTKEVLLGLTIGFAQIPESVAFAFLAHVKPPIALHAAWMIGLVCSIFGGRPAMVNGATGAFAAIISTFLPPPVENGGNGAGIELLFPSVMFAGLLMLGVGSLNLSKFILLLPAPVMIGFCNGLAIVIGAAQLHPFQDPETHDWKSGAELWWMITITLVSMLVMEFLPKIPLKIFKLIPSSLVAILMAVLIEFAIVRPTGSRTDTIRDVSEFTSETALPIPFFVDTPATDYDLSKIFASWDSVKNIAVQGLLLCTVGSIESLMTSEVVESYVKTPSNGQRTVFAMGIGNIISGFFGGMGGNAMIGLSTINVLNGGTSRIAPTTTALVVMAAVVGAYPILNFIPVAALAGIMLVVVIHTFKWFSLWMLPNLLPMCARRRLGLNSKIPRVEVAVILLVTLMAIFANIAYAVGAGIAVCAIMFAWNAGQDFEVNVIEGETKKQYHIEGPIFFTSANKLKKILNPDDDPAEVEVWFGHSSLMDYTAIATLHTAATEYKSKGKSIVFKSLNKSSQKIIEKANSLVEAIEYTPAEAIPSLSEGFRCHPAAAASHLSSRAREVTQEERSPLPESVGLDAQDADATVVV